MRQKLKNRWKFDVDPLLGGLFGGNVTPDPDHEVKFQRNGSEYRCWIQDEHVHVTRDGEELAQLPIPRRYLGDVDRLLDRLEGGSVDTETDG